MSSLEQAEAMRSPPCSISSATSKKACNNLFQGVGDGNGVSHGTVSGPFIEAVEGALNPSTGTENATRTVRLSRRCQALRTAQQCR